MKTTRRHPHSYRSIWISDVHLGTRGCRAEFLLDFLQSTECEQLYLVGDIVDLWSMRRGLYWPPVQNEVVRALLKKARGGTAVTYIPGNHDELFRAYDGMAFGAVRVRREAEHTTADGRRFLVLHGDEFDGAVRCGRFASLVGNVGYDLLLAVSRWVNHARRRIGFPYWSLAGYLKARLKNAARYMAQFDEAVAREAARREVDGLICGHIHRAEMKLRDSVLYCNTGDWVESCTALVEHQDGSMELVHWSDRRHSVCHLNPRPTVAARAAA